MSCLPSKNKTLFIAAENYRETDIKVFLLDFFNLSPQFFPGLYIHYQLWGFLNFLRRTHMASLEIFFLEFLSQTSQEFDPLHMHRRYARWHLKYCFICNFLQLIPNCFECFGCIFVTFSGEVFQNQKKISCQYS